MKRFERMHISTDIGLGALTELLAIGLQGNVSGVGFIENGGLVFDITADTAGGYNVIMPDDCDLEVEKEYLTMPIAMMLSAALIGGNPKVDGRYANYFPSKEFLEKHLTPSKMVLDRSSSLFHQLELSINDLQEIADTLCGNTNDIEALAEDKKFRAIFPGLAYRFGSYGPARHKSGVEVKADWSTEDGEGYHKLEAPIACEDLLNLWLREIGLEAYDPPFAQVRKAKWQLSKMLSKVPAADRMRVFDWVNDVSFNIEEFHSYKGGVPINSPLECEFGTGIMTVDTNMNWELVEV